MNKVNTVGELRKFLASYPDDKPVIFDYDGNTFALSVGDWYEEAKKDNTDWPIAFKLAE